eukprot:35237-Eustigmatos_ZCMA.PRE.1
MPAMDKETGGRSRYSPRAIHSHNIAPVSVQQSRCKSASKHDHKNKAVTHSPHNGCTQEEPRGRTSPARPRAGWHC